MMNVEQPLLVEDCGAGCGFVVGAGDASRLGAGLGAWLGAGDGFDVGCASGRSRKPAETNSVVESGQSTGVVSPTVLGPSIAVIGTTKAPAALPVVPTVAVAIRARSG